MAASYYDTPHWKALKRACRARDAGRCVVPGCSMPGVVCDHKIAREPVPYPTAADVLANVRMLCRVHDNQVKERRRGEPDRRGGSFRIIGCDVEGWPRDPARR